MRCYHVVHLLFSCVSSLGVYVEQHNSQGRDDLIVSILDYIYIFEFKLDGSVEAALRQIEGKQYATPFLTDCSFVVKIGASFGLKRGTIDDWKVA